MELPTRPLTGLLLRDSSKGDRSRSWAKRISTFSQRPGRAGAFVPAAVDLRAARNPNTNMYTQFDEPDENFRSPARQEQPMPVLPEAEEDAYWRDHLREWVATQAPVTEHGRHADRPVTKSAPVPPAIAQPSTRTPSPVGLGITLPREVHFSTPAYSTYREETTPHPKFPAYTLRATSSVISSIYEAYTAAAHAPPHEPILQPSTLSHSHGNSTSSAPPHHYQPNLPLTSSTAPSPSKSEKVNTNKLHCPATRVNAIPIAAPKHLTDIEKLNIRGFPSPGPSPGSTNDPTAAPRSTVRITARSKAWQTRLRRRHRRRVVVVSLSVLAVVCMLSGVIAALVVSSEGGLREREGGLERGLGGAV